QTGGWPMPAIATAQHQAAEPRMQPELGHGAAGGAETVLRIDSPQPLQQAARIGKALRRWYFGQHRSEVIAAPQRQFERQRRQIDLLNFRRIVRQQPALLFLIPQANAVRSEEHTSELQS